MKTGHNVGLMNQPLSEIFEESWAREFLMGCTEN
jgi:hypothetical protein